MHAPFVVLVTGLGALIGQGIAAGLASDGRARVLGLDRRASAYGASLCDRLITKPGCDEASSAYLAFWCELLESERIDLVLPGIGLDMEFLDANRAELEATGARLGLNTSSLIARSRDKLEFFDLLKAADLPRI